MTNQELVESAIQGLIMLGRSREEAIAELREAEDQQIKDAINEWWDSDVSDY